MKKVILLSVFLCNIAEICGQIYEREKPLFVLTEHRVHLCGVYERDKDGLYVFNDYEGYRSVSPDDFEKKSVGKERFYNYDNTNNILFFYTDNVIGYYNPSQNYPMKQVIKGIKNSNVPIVSTGDKQRSINIARSILDRVYKDKNDSISELRRIIKEKQLKAQRDEQEKKRSEYRKSHNWNNLILDYAVELNCRFCEDTHLERELYVISLSSDTIYYLQNRPDFIMMGKSYSRLHYGEMPKLLKENKKFKEYVETWRDSIASHNNLSNTEAFNINLIRYNQFRNEIRKEAPYGYIESWGWNLNYANGVEPYFTYYNTSPKTIKYVDFYFNLYNAVGDKCYLKYDKSYTGHVRGVGPVKSYDKGEWSWDKATHYTSGDASEMKIVKIVITYMDMTIKTLTENAIKYNQ